MITKATKSFSPLGMLSNQVATSDADSLSNALAAGDAAPFDGAVASSLLLLMVSPRSLPLQLPTAIVGVRTNPVVDAVRWLHAGAEVPSAAYTPIKYRRFAHPEGDTVKYPMRAILALSLTVSGALLATSAGASPSALVKVVQGPSYGFDNITDIASNGAHVWAVSTSNNSVTELKSGSGAVISVLKDKKFDFEGPERLERRLDPRLGRQRRRQLDHRTQRQHGQADRASSRVRSYKLHGTGFVTLQRRRRVDLQPSRQRTRRDKRVDGQLHPARQDQVTRYCPGQQHDLGRETRVGRRQR